MLGRYLPGGRVRINSEMIKPEPLRILKLKTRTRRTHFRDFLLSLLNQPHSFPPTTCPLFPAKIMPLSRSHIQFDLFLTHLSERLGCERADIILLAAFVIVGIQIHGAGF